MIEGDLVILGVPSFLNRIPYEDDVLLDEGGQNSTGNIHGDAGDVFGEGEVVSVTRG